MTTTPSDRSLQHILVTGGTGFLGAWVIRQLVLDGFRVSAIKRKESTIPAFIEPDILGQVNWLEGDVLDLVSLEDALQGVDAVIHSAAIVSFLKEDRKKMYTTNVEGTANLVNLALEMGIKRLVMVSSVAALGRTAKGEEVDEKKSWTESKSNTHYALSKYWAEMEMWRAMAEGLNGVIVNPSTIIGYGNWNNSSCAIFRNAYDEFPWYSNGVNGFVSVEDTARAIVALLQSEITNERFILNGENWSFRQLFDTIAEGFGKKKPRLEATPLLSQLAWRLEKLKSWFSGKKPLLSKETAKIAQSQTYFNNQKLLQHLPGFRYTPLRDAILQSCARYLQEQQP